MSESETTVRTVSESDAITITRPEIYAHEPIAGEYFYAWVPETHPRFEEIRDDLYGWLTHRGVNPEDIWVGIVPAAKIPLRWKEALDTSYRVQWVSEKSWRLRCRSKHRRRKALRKRRTRHKE